MSDVKSDQTRDVNLSPKYEVVTINLASKINKIMPYCIFH
jgi:hypothetical protein